jgi:hypothetical protein
MEKFTPSSLTPTIVLLFLWVATALVPRGAGTEVFLEEPQNTTVQESETAIFRCSVVNLSTVWLVNGSDAGYTVFQMRGVIIVPEPNDHTRSQLKVAGHVYNNNTQVRCVAVQEYPELIWINSKTALLIVQEAPVERFTHTGLHSSLPTQAKELSKASGHSPPYKTVSTWKLHASSMKPTHPQTTIDTEQRILKLFWTIFPVIFSLLIVVIFTLVILLISMKRRKVGGTKDGDIMLGPNPVYECTKPIKLHKNELYELSKLIQCQKNSA